MRLVMEPLDVLFFRDARAFGAGADHRARALLPPPPTTLHGALRTFLAWQRGWRPGMPLDPALGSADDPGPLRVRGPFLARRVGAEVWTRHPFPADAVALASGEDLWVAPRQVGSEDWVYSDAGRELAWARAGADETLADQAPAALEVGELLRYLRGEKVRLGESGRRGFGLGLARPEPRVGVALDRLSRTAREGFLYTAEFARLLPEAVLVGDAWLDGGSLPEKGLLPLGGEGRLVTFCAEADYDWEIGEASRAVSGARHVRLYLLTPAPFPAGSWPPGIEEGGEGILAGRRVRVVAACLGRPVRVSGFDLARGRPRPSRRAVPAGSVYRLELLDGGADEAFVRALHGRSLFPEGSVEERLGWGQVLVGVGPKG